MSREFSYSQVSKETLTDTAESFLHTVTYIQKLQVIQINYSKAVILCQSYTHVMSARTCIPHVIRYFPIWKEKKTKKNKHTKKTKTQTNNKKTNYKITGSFHSDAI